MACARMSILRDTMDDALFEQVVLPDGMLIPPYQPGSRPNG